MDTVTGVSKASMLLVDFAIMNPNLLTVQF
jgi:hypothetical protein